MSFIAIGLGAALRGAISGWWGAFKKRRTGAVPMTDRDGVWQIDRSIPHIERAVGWLGYIGLAGLAVGAAAAIIYAVHPPA